MSGFVVQSVPTLFSHDGLKKNSGNPSNTDFILCRVLGLKQSYSLSNKMTSGNNSFKLCIVRWGRGTDSFLGAHMLPSMFFLMTKNNMGYMNA